MYNNNLYQTFWEIIKLARTPNLFIIIITQYFTAVFIAAVESPPAQILSDLNLLLLVLSTVIIASAGYFINDYYDIKIDMINKPDKVIVGSKLARRPVLIWHGIFNVTGILMGLYVSIWIGAINMLAAFLLWIYSNQLKRMPLVGNVSVALLTGLSILVVAVYYQSNEYLIFIYAFFAFGITLIREIIKDIEDMKGDENFGCKSIPILYGIRKTKVFLYSLGFLFGISISMFLRAESNTFLNLYFLLLIFPSSYFLYALYKADRTRHFRQLSTYCKWLMISGILSMIFIY